MKKIIAFLACSISLFVQAQSLVASFKGAQVTGITVSADGRIFANFPRWREGIPFSVVEIKEDGSYKPFPDLAWNQWQTSQTSAENQFVAIQSLLAVKDELFVLETANPQFKGVMMTPKILVFDLKTNQFKKSIPLSEGSYHKNSYINDLRYDAKRNWMYLTDSGVGGLVILDLNTQTSKRYLDQHLVTSAETNELHFKNGVWKNTVHSDGIEYDSQKDTLYFHSLTGYTLYGISINDLLQNEVSNITRIKTAAPDGLALDAKGNLYFADLEHDKIQYLTPKRQIKTLKTKTNTVKWADSFAIYNDFLYYTNSRINEAKGDISNLDFTIYKIRLPKN